MPQREIKIIKKKIKNMYLRIEQDKTIPVTAPRTTSNEDIARFIFCQEDWITRTLNKIPVPVIYTYDEGKLHTYLGRILPLHVEQGTRQ